MRILWVSNGPRVPTGYGNQTGMFVHRLKEAGHDPAVFAYYGVEGAPSVNEHGIKIFPRQRDLYGNDIVAAHADFHKADVVITLMDAFVCDPNVYRPLEWIAWAPIDSEPIFPANIPSLRVARRIWAMSRFGEQQLHDAGFENVDYVPHGVDTKVFTPIDRAAARQYCGERVQRDLTGKFIVMMNAANKGQPSRKGFFEALAAFKIFSETHPDAVFYIHTDPVGVWGGEDLETIMVMVGLTQEQVIFPQRYLYIAGMLSETYLNNWYNAADVYLHTSHGEGFGIPLIEAQAAGCPIIATKFSAMDELNFTGWDVPGVPFMAAPGMLQHIPVVPAVAQALEQAYENRDNAILRAETASAATVFDVDRVLEQYMLPALVKFQAEKANREELAEKRAMMRKLARPGEEIPEAI